jgi:argininosuccinate lyase
VALASEAGKELEELTLSEMQGVEPAITSEIFDVLGVEKSVRSRLSYGGTAPQNVLEQARGWKQKLAKK